MERRPNQETLKVSHDARVLLRQIALRTGEKHYRILHRLLAMEWQRLEQQQQKG